MTDPMTSLESLAAQVEAADGPSRELDARIWCALNGKRYLGHNQAYNSTETQVEFTEPPKRRRMVSGPYGLTHAVQYTASIDAAMTLVPAGMTWSLDEGPLHWILAGKAKPAGRAQIHRVGDYINSVTGDLAEVSEHGFGANPALAICAAALRARARSLVGEGEADNDEWGCDHCRNDGRLEFGRCPKCDAEFPEEDEARP